MPQLGPILFFSHLLFLSLAISVCGALSANIYGSLGSYYSHPSDLPSLTW